MKAVALLRRQIPVTESAYASIVIWQLPKPVPPSTHGFKYRLAYVVDGVCVLRYDNERGKGDHRHWGEEQAPYAFADLDALLSDFRTDIARWNDENRDF